MRRGGESDQRVECDKSLVDQLVVVDSGWKQGCGLVPQHTGCKQRSCSGKEEEEEEGSNTAEEEEEWWARRGKEKFKEKKERGRR